jgi:hypothetical protein
MPTEPRFDDLDLREQPQTSAREVNLTTRPTQYCNNTHCCTSISCETYYC